MEPLQHGVGAAISGALPYRTYSSTPWDVKTGQNDFCPGPIAGHSQISCITTVCYNYQAES